MTYEQKNIPLTEDDRRKILKLKKKMYVGAGFFGALFFSIVFGFGISEFRKFGPGTIFMGAFALFAIGIFICIVLYTTARYKKDLKAGLKKKIRGKITDKQKQVVTRNSGKNQTTTYYYYFFFDAFKLTVDRAHYNLAEPGDEIEIEMTMESASVLNFNKLSGNSSASIGPQVVKTQTPIEQLSEMNAAADSVQTNFNARPDKEELMSDENVKLLRKERARRITWWIILTLISAIPFVILYFGLIVALAFTVPAFLRYLIFFQVSWLLVFILFRFHFFRKRIIPIGKDLAEGKKVLKEKMVQEKIFSNVKMSSGLTAHSNTGGEYYYIKANNSLIGLSRADFNAIKDHQPAVFHIAPFSEITLQVKPFNK
jgi:hypothetical protein